MAAKRKRKKAISEPLPDRLSVSIQPDPKPDILFLSDRFKFGKSKLFGNILKHHLHRHANFDLFRVAPDNVTPDDRPLLQLDQSINIGNSVLKNRIEGHMMDVECEHLSLTARIDPLHIAVERLVLMVAAARYGPIPFAALLATKEFKLMLLTGIPKWFDILINIRKRFIIFS